MKFTRISYIYIYIIYDVSESQSIDIISINLNNHVFDDCESPSIEINDISLSNSTLNNHMTSDNIATKVKTKNEEGRKKKEESSQEITTFKAWNIDNTSPPESLSYEYQSQR